MTVNKQSQNSKLFNNHLIACYIFMTNCLQPVENFVDNSNLQEKTCLMFLITLRNNFKTKQT